MITTKLLNHIIRKTILSELKCRVNKPLLEVEGNKVPAEEVLKEYKKLEAEIEREKKAIADILQRIKSKETTQKKLYDLIELLMKEQGKTEIQIENAIAALVEGPAYKQVRADYKTLWEQALSKVNAVTRAVLEQMMEVHLELKRQERKTELVIKEGQNGGEFELAQSVHEWVNAYKELKLNLNNLLKLSTKQ